MAATRSARSSGTPRSRYESRRSSNPDRSRPVSSLGRPGRTVSTPSAKNSTVAWMSNGGRRLCSSQRAARSVSLRPSSSSVIWAADADPGSLQRLDLVPEGRHVEHLAGDQPGPGEVRYRRAGLLDQPEQERGARGVDHLVDHRGGDDLAAQPVRHHPVREPAPAAGRGSRRRAPGAGTGRRAGSRRARPRPPRSWCARAAGRARGWSARGPRTAARRSPARPAASSCSGLSRLSPDQLAQVPRVHVEQARRLGPGDGQRHVLPVVVPQDQAATSLGHLLRAARAGRRRACPRRRIASASRILMLTSWSEVSTPAELSMKSVLIRPPPSAYSIRAALGEAEVAALADDPGPQLGWRRPGPRRWTGRRRRRCDSVRGLDVGADAAVPEQVDRARRRIARDQLVRGQRGDAASRPSAARTCGEQRDRLGRARPDPAAGRDQRRVVVRPRGRGQLEQPLRARRSWPPGRGPGRGTRAGGRRRRPA